jgi:hypothetical protein
MKKEIRRKRIVLRKIPIQIMIIKSLENNENDNEIVNNYLYGGEKNEDVDIDIFKLILDLTYLIFF